MLSPGNSPCAWGQGPKSGYESGRIGEWALPFPQLFWLFVHIGSLSSRCASYARMIPVEHLSSFFEVLRSHSAQRHGFSPK